MKNFLKRIYIILLTTPYFVFAQNSLTSGISPNTPGTTKGLVEFVGSIEGLVQQILTLLVGLSIFAIMWGLMTTMTNPGNSDKQAQAKHIIIWGILGVFVMVSIFGILSLATETIVGP